MPSEQLAQSCEFLVCSVDIPCDDHNPKCLGYKREKPCQQKRKIDKSRSPVSLVSVMGEGYVCRRIQLAKPLWILFTDDNRINPSDGRATSKWIPMN